jgi:uncharacterized membrane protein SpoIIM required for sporulation
MDWIQIFTIIGVITGLFAILISTVVWMVGKLDADVKSIGSKMDLFSSRMDSFATRMDGHAQRIDQLYQMFISLVKENRK